MLIVVYFCHQDIATYVTFGDTCTWGKVKLQNFLRTAYNSFSLGIECLSICKSKLFVTLISPHNNLTNTFGLGTVIMSIALL